MSRFTAGAIVLVDWRGGALPSEPTKIRPCVVVVDADLFPDGYPNVLVVPITRNTRLAYPAFSELITPSEENGASTDCWALAHHVSAVSSCARNIRHHAAAQRS